MIVLGSRQLLTIPLSWHGTEKSINYWHKQGGGGSALKSLTTPDSHSKLALFRMQQIILGMWQYVDMRIEDNMPFPAAITGELIKACTARPIISNRISKKLNMKAYNVQGSTGMKRPRGTSTTAIGLAM
jgi:hypothetical protein